MGLMSETAPPQVWPTLGARDAHDTEYGSHYFALRDPEGDRWFFGTYRGEPR
jgi:hypothetical protein